MLRKIPFMKLMNLKNVFKIETVASKNLEKFGLISYGLSLKKDGEVVLKDGESAYINDELIVRLDSSLIYLHHLKVDEEVKEIAKEQLEPKVDEEVKTKKPRGRSKKSTPTK